MRSLCFYYFTASETARADFDAFHRTVDFNADSHKIRPELTARQVVSMADVVSEHAFFSTDFTLARHYITSINFTQIRVFNIIYYT